MLPLRLSNYPVILLWDNQLMWHLAGPIISIYCVTRDGTRKESGTRGSRWASECQRAQKGQEVKSGRRYTQTRGCLEVEGPLLSGTLLGGHKGQSIMILYRPVVHSKIGSDVNNGRVPHLLQQWHIALSHDNGTTKYLEEKLRAKTVIWNPWMSSY